MDTTPLADALAAAKAHALNTLVELMRELADPDALPTPAMKERRLIATAILRMKEPPPDPRPEPHAAPQQPARTDTRPPEPRAATPDDPMVTPMPTTRAAYAAPRPAPAPHPSVASSLRRSVAVLTPPSSSSPPSPGSVPRAIPA